MSDGGWTRYEEAQQDAAEYLCVAHAAQYGVYPEISDKCDDGKDEDNKDMPCWKDCPFKLRREVAKGKNGHRLSAAEPRFDKHLMQVEKVTK